MAKANRPSRKSSTYFEQVPLQDVLKRRRSSATQATGGAHFHGVRFYDDAHTLGRIVGSFIGEGLERRDIALIIATPEHAALIESCLRARGIDVDQRKRDGLLVMFDARETLQLFMRNGMPDPGAFRRALSAAFVEARRRRGPCAIRAYGEMIDLLWKDGLESAAIHLETLWNQLARVHDFELLCAYSIGNFYKGAAVENIQRQHTHLVAEDGTTSALTGAA